jgi:hypothetical protein
MSTIGMSYVPPIWLIARLTAAISSPSECNASCTAIALCPAFFKIRITLLHEDQSAPAPWTRTILVVMTSNQG